MSDELDQVGARLRAARHARNWTLEDLAGRAGLSVSTLSRLEAGKRQASLELLLPLTRQLGIRIDDLLPAISPDPRVRRAVERRDGMIIAPLTLEHSPVQAIKIVYAPRASAPEPKVHDGYEWLYVLSGRLRLVLGEHEHLVESGEAVEFSTWTPHWFGAVDGPVEVILVVGPDGERVHLHQ
jgi:transcriptional regulator with XRE-family HTH domain